MKPYKRKTFLIRIKYLLFILFYFVFLFYRSKAETICFWNAPTRGRCYDHNFLRFLPIFGEKIGVFLKNQCYDQNLA
jgi:hypothetical protein